MALEQYALSLLDVAKQLQHPMTDREAIDIPAMPQTFTDAEQELFQAVRILYHLIEKIVDEGFERMTSEGDYVGTVNKSDFAESVHDVQRKLA